MSASFSCLSFIWPILWFSLFHSAMFLDDFSFIEFINLFWLCHRSRGWSKLRLWASPADTDWTLQHMFHKSDIIISQNSPIILLHTLVNTDLDRWHVIIQQTEMQGYILLVWFSFRGWGVLYCTAALPLLFPIKVWSLKYSCNLSLLIPERPYRKCSALFDIWILFSNGGET